MQVLFWEDHKEVPSIRMERLNGGEWKGLRHSKRRPDDIGSQRALHFILNSMGSHSRVLRSRETQFM